MNRSTRLQLRPHTEDATRFFANKIFLYCTFKKRLFLESFFNIIFIMLQKRNIYVLLILAFVISISTHLG